MTTGAGHRRRQRGKLKTRLKRPRRSRRLRWSARHGFIRATGLESFLIARRRLVDAHALVIAHLFFWQFPADFLRRVLSGADLPANGLARHDETFTTPGGMSFRSSKNRKTSTRVRITPGAARGSNASRGLPG
jgi:hypothetical protein